MSKPDKLHALMAEYCEDYGEVQHDELYTKLVMSKDLHNFVSFLVEQIKHVEPNAQANAVRKATAEADAAAIRECYAILINEEGKSTTEAVAELELAFNCSNSKVQAAIKTSDVNKGYEQLQRNSWIWYDYGPCFAEHKGIKQEVFKELADRHDLSVSTIKRILNSDNILAKHFINKNPGHSWLPYPGSYTPDGKQWSGRLAELCRDYRKAVLKAVGAQSQAEATVTYLDAAAQLHQQQPEKLAEIKQTLRKRYGFRLDQLEQLLETYPLKIVRAEWQRKQLSKAELIQCYELTENELEQLLTVENRLALPEDAAPMNGNSS